MSYEEAVKQIGRTTVGTDGDYMDVPVVSGPTVRADASHGPGRVLRPVQKCCAHPCVASKDTLIMNQVDFITFIGKVINFKMPG